MQQTTTASFQNGLDLFCSGNCHERDSWQSLLTERLKVNSVEKTLVPQQQQQKKHDIFDTAEHNRMSECHAVEEAAELTICAGKNQKKRLLLKVLLTVKYPE